MLQVYFGGMMKDLDFNKIFDSMKNNDISELIIKEGSKTYEVRRGGFKQNIVQGGGSAVMPVGGMMPQMQAPVQVQAPVQQAAPTGGSTPVQEKDSADAGSSAGSDYFEQKSPLVGTFYSSPKPDSPSYVEVGDKIVKGQTLCMVEAMKNFNEIESEVDGVLREVCINNSDMVEFGQVLFRIETK
jgi:acetyl-CoA carboxylase biotin carboxyl carrier protein